LIPKVLHKYIKLDDKKELVKPITSGVLEDLFLDYYYYNGGSMTKMFV
jgi:hypothetical protein